MTRTRYTVSSNGARHGVTVDEVAGGRMRVTVDEETIELDLEQVASREYHVLLGDRSLIFLVDGDLPKLEVHHDGAVLGVDLLDERQQSRMAATGAGARRRADGKVSIKAPMPGKVVKRLVQEGEQVAAGQGVIVVEAMKMENELRTSVGGTVRSIRVAEGANVEAGECLVVIE